ncbi:MAG: hypothetical protein ACO1SV_02745 [Fimbriimonas sp.]
MNLPARDDRIVFTLAFGHRKFAEMALGLGRSLRLIGDTTKRVVLTDLEGFPWEKSFDQVIYQKVPPEDLWWAKLYGLKYTDAKRVVVIDSDSLVFKRLDPIFDAFEGAPFGVQGIVSNKGQWYGPDISETCAKAGVKEIVKLNAGLMYYERGPEVEALLAEAKAAAADAARYGWKLARGMPSEEICFAVAMARTGIGRSVPEEANFTNSGVGLVGKLRMDVMRNECEYLCRRYSLQRVEPYVFHAHFHKSFFIYWRQLQKLAWLERYEETHRYGYMSPLQKLDRSIQRRILKHLMKRI